MADKYTSDNLYVDDIINFEYVVNPDKDDDLDLYEYAKELRNTKFKQVLIPFKFNMGQEGDINDYFVFTKEYDDENQMFGEILSWILQMDNPSGIYLRPLLDLKLQRF